MDIEKQIKKAVTVFEWRRIVIFLKYCLLILSRMVHKLLHNLPSFLSYCLLVFSVIVCIFVLGIKTFHQVPVLSFYIQAHELPTAYQLNGSVSIFDYDENVIDTNTEVYIGGYTKQVSSSSQFSIDFTSPPTNGFYVVIRYNYNEKNAEYIEFIEFDDNCFDYYKEFIIHVKDL